MKKTLLALLCLLCVLCCLTACAKHEHSWSTEWESDSLNHWHACTDSECAEHDSVAPHSGGTATCAEKAKCEVCGTAYGELGECVPGAPIRTGTPATCTQPGVITERISCTLCGEEISSTTTNVPATGHTNGAPIETVLTPATCTAVGSKKVEVKCTVCDEVVSSETVEIPMIPHTGGTATCTTKASCEVCQTAYGELDANNHSGVAGNAVANNNGTHTLTYACCNATVAEDCSGGIANCQNKALCEVCGVAYGELDPNKHLADQSTYVDNGDGTHTVTATCCAGVSGVVESHRYVWDKSNEEYDILTCEFCDAVDNTSKINKIVTADPVKLILSSDDPNNPINTGYFFFSKQTIEQCGQITTFGVDMKYRIGDVYFCEGSDIGNLKLTAEQVAEIGAHKEWHGETFAIVFVKDAITGDYHEIKYPVTLITRIINSYQDWFDYVYPVKGDTIGYYKLGSFSAETGFGFNFTNNSWQSKVMIDSAPVPAGTLPQAKGAFKGTLVGNGDIAIAGGQYYGRHIFGALDGAVLKDILFQDYQVTGIKEGRGLFGTTIKNTTFSNVRIWMSGTYGVVGGIGSGWLASGEVSGNTFNNLEIVVKISTEVLPNIFGNKFDNNTINGLTITGAGSIDMPIIGQSSDGTKTVTYCSLTGGHTFDDTKYSSDETGHWVACSGCGLVKDGSLSEHTWDNADGVVTTEPTCTEDGVRTWTCTVCDYEKTQAIDKKGHNYGELVPAKEESCTYTGNRAYYHCEACDTYFDETKVASNLTDLTIHTNPDKHAYAPQDGLAATCTEAGYTAYDKCAFCNHESGKTVIDALGHTEETIPAVDATCTETGLSEGKKCSVCGEILVAQQEVPTIAHTSEVIPAVDATCTKEGSTAGSKCSVCGEILVAPETTSKLPHTSEVIEAVPATCTEDGSTAGSKCSVCGEILVAPEVANKLGHTVVTDEAVAPTCTETGLTEGSHCSRCGTVLVAPEKVDALGHVVVVDEAVAPTCTETGLTEGSHCSRCGTVLVAQEKVDALGHVVVVDERVEPDCDTTGLTEGSHCSRCETTLVAQTVIAALGHKNAAAVEENYVAPTCKDAGSKDVVVYCSVCDEELSRETQTIAKLTTHTPGQDGGSNETQHWGICSVCGAQIDPENHAPTGEWKTVVESDVEYHYQVCTCGYQLNKAAHTAGTPIENVTKDATCTAEGSKTVTTKCSVCDKVISTQVVAIPMVAHTFTKETATDGYLKTAADCTNDAIYYKSCAVCNLSSKGQTGESTFVVADSKLGHVAVVDAAVAPTCTATGLTEGSHCSRCETTLVAQKEVAVLGHDYQPVEGSAVAATCTTDGKQADQKCLRCNNVVTGATITALGHDFVQQAGKDATCLEAGYTAFEKCSRCGTETGKQPIQATGHAQVEIPAVEATCTSKGATAGVKCSTCQTVLTAPTEIPAKGHLNDVTLPAVDATCTATGLTQGTKCTACDTITVEQTVVPALGHDYGTLVEKVAPTCQRAGTEAHYLCTACNTYFTEGKVETTADALVIDATPDVHNYVWNTTNPEFDIRACADCDLVLAESRINKILDVAPVEIILSGAGKKTSALVFDKDAIKALNSDITTYGVDMKYSFAGIEFGAGNDIQNVAIDDSALASILALTQQHGNTYITIYVKDATTGAYHAIQHPVLIVTATIGAEANTNKQNAAELMNAIFPVSGDKYGYYRLNYAINLADMTEATGFENGKPVPQGSFKGTLVGHGADDWRRIVAWGNNGGGLFGNLDGATIKDLKIEMNGYYGTGLYKDRVYLGLNFVNSTMENVNVVFTEFVANYTTICDKGLLFGGNVNNSTLANVTLKINADAFAGEELMSIFGSKFDFDSMTISNFVITSDTQAVLDAGFTFVQAGQITKDGETIVYSVCDVTNNGVHTFGSTWSHDSSYHFNTCTLCGAIDESSKGEHAGITSNGDGTHSVSCTACGYTSTEAVACEYVWNKSASNVDVGTCACEHQVTFDKEIEGLSRRPYTANEDGFFGYNQLINIEANRSKYSYDLVDESKEVSVYIDGVFILSMGTNSPQNFAKNETLIANRLLHGNKDIVVVVTDKFGETHEIKYPVTITTATINSYQDWFDYIYPVNGDTIGYFKLGTGLNLSGNDWQSSVTINGSQVTTSAYPTAKGAFKGTLIGNGDVSVAGGQYYGRNIFGNLDGATIKDILLQDYQPITTNTSRALFGGYMKNTTLSNVRIWMSGISDGGKVGTNDVGWLVSGEFSNNTVNGLAITVRQNYTSLPNLFGTKLSGTNTFSNITIVAKDDSITLPAVMPIVGRTTDGVEITICDANSGHSYDTSAYAHDASGHYYACSVCGMANPTSYAAHAGMVSDGAGKHTVTCSTCNYTSGEAVACELVWDKSASDVDVGTCACGFVVNFDKLAETINQTSVTIGSNAYLGFQAHVADATYGRPNEISMNLIDADVPVVLSVNGVVIHADQKVASNNAVNLGTNEVFVANRQCHGYQNAVFTVTDIYGETHDITKPLFTLTKTIESAKDWFDYIYPANGDTYGYYKQGTAFKHNFHNFTLADAGLTAYPTAKGAFKGTFVGLNDANYAFGAGSEFSRNLFGNLDGATIEGIVVVEYQYIGSATKAGQGLLANNIKNTTFKNVTVKLWSGNYSSATATDKGWLAYGEVSGNTFTSFTLYIQKTCNVIPPVFGDNFHDNTFTNSITVKLDTGVTLPGELVIGKNSVETFTLCDINGHVGSEGEVCSVCQNTIASHEHT